MLADTNSARVLFQVLDLFKDISGLKINSTKTEGMWIGASKESKAKPLGIKWPNEPIKALGVYFTYDPKLLKEKISLIVWIVLKNLSTSGPLEAYLFMARLQLSNPFLFQSLFTFARYCLHLKN